MVSRPIADRALTFAVTDTKLHVPVIDLPTQDNTKLNEQLTAITIKKKSSRTNINETYQRIHQISI